MAGVDMDFLNKMFDTLDSDKNGSISEAELIDVFKKFDTDGTSRSLLVALVQSRGVFCCKRKHI